MVDKLKTESNNFPASEKKKHLVLYTFTALWAICVAIAFTPIMNPPQCPSNATRMPDGGYCIIGADIGSGLWIIFLLIPFSLVMLVMWSIRVYGHLKN